MAAQLRNLCGRGGQVPYFEGYIAVIEVFQRITAQDTEWRWCCECSSEYVEAGYNSVRNNVSEIIGLAEIVKCTDHHRDLTRRSILIKKNLANALREMKMSADQHKPECDDTFFWSSSWYRTKHFLKRSRGALQFQESLANHQVCELEIDVNYHDVFIMRVLVDRVRIIMTLRFWKEKDCSRKTSGSDMIRESHVANFA